MAEQDAQDRRLPASQRKLDKARKDGQVARSRDLGHFGALTMGAAALVLLAPQWFNSLEQMLQSALRFDVRGVMQPSYMGMQLGELAKTLLWITVPLGMLLVLVAVSGALACGGWAWTRKPLGPKFSAINPLTGFARLFSKQQLVNTFKASVLALILVGLGGLYIHTNLDEFGGVLTLALPEALAQSARTVQGGVLLLLLVLAAFALGDVPLQRHQHREKLKMSHQELKQEQKESEGNVEVKTKVRARMRETSRRRMLAAVLNADLVVMNPTHYAVALKYDEARMGAPRVVAKGADLMALRIRDAAKGADVPVLQAAMLARALYAHAELDSEIPVALFAAVAQVLAYVYQLRASLRGSAPMPAPPADLPVPADLDPHRQLAKENV